MARPLERLKPIGFWSYARQDDEKSDGRLSRLRFQLANELQLIYGKQTITIFQDLAAIAPGAEWEKAIDDAINQATFFIPILTPAFVESEWCCREVSKFLMREAAINTAHPELEGRRRIFPIRYIDSRNAEMFDPAVFEALGRVQETDFQPLRRESDQSPLVRDKLVTLADALAALLQVRVQRPPTASELAEEGRRRAAAEEQQRIAEADRLAEIQRKLDEAAAEATANAAAQAEADRFAQAAKEQADREAAERRAVTEQAEREAAAQRAREAEKTRLAAEDRQREQQQARREASAKRAEERAAAWGRLRTLVWKWRVALVGASGVVLAAVLFAILRSPLQDRAAKVPPAQVGASNGTDVVTGNDQMLTNVNDNAGGTTGSLPPDAGLGASPLPIRPDWIEGNWRVAGQANDCPIKITISADGRSLSFARARSVKPVDNEFSFNPTKPKLLTTARQRYELITPTEIRVTALETGDRSRLLSCVP